jgi:putative ABC transport system permease protein
MDDWDGWNFVTADNPNPPAGEIPDANYVVIGPDYFRALGIPVHSGRPFLENDTPSAEPAVIVSQSLADKYWPGQNPIGKRLKISSNPNEKSLPWLSVVGVVGNVKSQGQFAPFVPEIYVPYTQFPWILYPRHIVVRTTSSPAAIVPAIRQEVVNLDKEVPIADITSIKEIVASRVRPNQTVMILLGSFAGLALMLAAFGIYSVISYAVTERTHEIGIRMALGADRESVTRMVVRHGLLLTTVGVALGLLGALGITRLLSSLPLEIRVPLLFDVRPLDPLTLVSVSVLLILVALMACYIPARRATHVQPSVALRYE